MSPEPKYLKKAGLYPEFLGDNKDQLSFMYWTTLWLSAAYQRAKSGSFILMFSDWRQLPATSSAMQAGNWIQRGVVSWDKTQAVRPQPNAFRSQCEYVLWGTKGKKHRKGPTLPGSYCHGIGQKHHIAGKPIPLISDLLKIIPTSETVLDPFVGAGSTALACLQSGHECIGIEMDHMYFQKTCERVRAEIEAGK